MEIPRHWRLKAQRYCLEGSACSKCGQLASPAPPGLSSLYKPTNADQSHFIDHGSCQQADLLHDYPKKNVGLAGLKCLSIK